VQATGAGGRSRPVGKRPARDGGNSRCNGHRGSVSATGRQRCGAPVSAGTWTRSPRFRGEHRAVGAFPFSGLLPAFRRTHERSTGSRSSGGIPRGPTPERASARRRTTPRVWDSDRRADAGDCLRRQHHDLVADSDSLTPIRPTTSIRHAVRAPFRSHLIFGRHLNLAPTVEQNMIAGCTTPARSTSGRSPTRRRSPMPTPTCLHHPVGARPSRVSPAALDATGTRFRRDFRRSRVPTTAALLSASTCRYSTTARSLPLNTTWGPTVSRIHPRARRSFINADGGRLALAEIRQPPRAQAYIGHFGSLKDELTEFGSGRSRSQHRAMSPLTSVCRTGGALSSSFADVTAGSASPCLRRQQRPRVDHSFFIWRRRTRRVSIGRDRHAPSQKLYAASRSMDSRRNPPQPSRIVTCNSLPIFRPGRPATSRLTLVDGPRARAGDGVGYRRQRPRGGGNRAALRFLYGAAREHVYGRAADYTAERRSSSALAPITQPNSWPLRSRNRVQLLSTSDRATSATG